MFQRTESPTASMPDPLAVEAHQLIDKLLSHQPHSTEMALWLREVGRLVSGMGLGAAEHGLARLRLRKAARFVEAREFGAAKFEIRHLISGLREHLQRQEPVAKGLAIGRCCHPMVPSAASV